MSKGITISLRKGQKALFYQSIPKMGYYTTFQGYVNHNGITQYNTKIGLFKNAKNCTLDQFVKLTQVTNKDGTKSNPQEDK